MKSKTLFLLLLLGSCLLNAQETRKYSNEFLNIGVDARAFAMGNSVVAHTQDATAGYWNPAGLAALEGRWKAAAMHASYFQNIASYDYAGFALPLNNGNTVGVSLIRFGVDDILNTTQLIDEQGNIDYDRISTFSTADYALMASYAGQFFPNLDVNFGVNAKIVYRHVGKFANSIGFGFDVGMQHQTQDDFFFGVMVRDITTTFNAWNINEDELEEITVTEPGTGREETLNSLPEENLELTLPKLQLGVGKKLALSDRFTLTGEVDLNFRFAETNDLVSTSGLSMSPSAGFELGFDEMVYVRGGITNFQYETDFEEDRKLTMQPNFGVGFRYKGISVDYALTDIGDQSIALYSNVFSVKLDMEAF